MCTPGVCGLPLVCVCRAATLYGSLPAHGRPPQPSPSVAAAGCRRGWRPWRWCVRRVASERGRGGAGGGRVRYLYALESGNTGTLGRVVATGGPQREVLLDRAMQAVRYATVRLVEARTVGHATGPAGGVMAVHYRCWLGAAEIHGVLRVTDSAHGPARVAAGVPVTVTAS